MVGITAEAKLKCNNCYNTMTSDVPFMMMSHSDIQRELIDDAITRGWTAIGKGNALCPKCITEAEANDLDQGDLASLITSFIKKMESRWYADNLVKNLDDKMAAHVLAHLFSRLDPREKCPPSQEVNEYIDSIVDCFEESFNNKNEDFIIALACVLKDITKEEEEE